MRSSAEQAGSFSALLLDGIFARIWSAIFVSATATFFLLMTLSAHILEREGSITFANLVVLTQWLPALFALPAIKIVSAKFSARHILTASDAACGLVCLLLLAGLSNIWIILTLLLIRGAFDSLSKVARTTALRDYFTGEALDRAASYYNTAMLIGGGAGAVFGAVAYGNIDLNLTIAACCILYIISASIYFSLPLSRSASVPTSQTNDLSPSSDGSIVDVQRAAIYFVGAVALFQGFHNFARSAYPVEHLGLSVSFVPIMQILTNFSYVVGAVLAAQLVMPRSYRALPLATHLAGVAIMVAFIFPLPIAFGLPSYFIFGLVFEVGFCLHLRYIITKAPKESVGRYVANANAAGMAGMVAVAFGGSLLAEIYGFVTVTVLVMVLAASVPMVAEAAPARILKFQSKTRTRGA